MTKGKINGFQLFAIIFICRIIALFTFIIPRRSDFGAGDRVFFILPFFILCIIAAVPVLLVTENGKHDIFTAASNTSVPITKGLGIFYAAVFLLAAALSTARFELFISTVMYPADSTALLTLLLLGTASFVASRGPETLGRSSVIVFFLLIFSLVFIIISTCGKFDPLNLTRPFADGVSSVFINALHSVSRTVEITSLVIAAGFTNGGIKKTAICGMGVFSAVAAVIFLLIGGVTGLYGEQQMFQLYTITAIAKFGVFERMDAILTGFWVLCAFFKTAYFIMLAVISVQRSFNVNCGKGIYIIPAAAVFAIYKAISKTTVRFAEVIGSPVIETVFILSTVVIPLAVFALNRTHKNKAQTERIKAT